MPAPTREAHTAPLTLAIEVSNPSAHLPSSSTPTALSRDATGPSVALARASSILDQEALHTPDSRHDDDLMPAIDRLVRRAGLHPAALERIAVSIGPGGFTGLRVAIATAKALAETIALRTGRRDCCIPVPTALVAAANMLATNPAPATPFAVALASKRDSTFLTLLTPDALPLSPSTPHQPQHIGALADAAALESLHRAHTLSLLIADNFLPQPMRDAAARLGIPILPPILSAAACARLAASIPPIDPADLLPLYPREPEAVTKWRTLHPRP